MSATLQKAAPQTLPRDVAARDYLKLLLASSVSLSFRTIKVDRVVEDIRQPDSNCLLEAEIIAKKLFGFLSHWTSNQSSLADIFSPQVVSTLGFDAHADPLHSAGHTFCDCKQFFKNCNYYACDNRRSTQVNLPPVRDSALCCAGQAADLIAAEQTLRQHKERK